MENATLFCGKVASDSAALTDRSLWRLAAACCFPEAPGLELEAPRDSHIQGIYTLNYRRIPNMIQGIFLDQGILEPPGSIIYKLGHYIGV